MQRSGNNYAITLNLSDNSGFDVQNVDLSELFESAGQFVVVADGQTLTINMEGRDTTEPYQITDAAVQSFYDYFTGEANGSHAAAITVRDFVPAAPSFADDTGDAIDGTVGTAIADITVPEAAGTPAPTYAAVGSLPAGVSFDPDTRIISFDEDAIEAGSGMITIRATNSEGMDDWTVAYSFAAGIPDANAPSVTISAVADGDEGTVVTISASLNGGNYDAIDYDWQVSGGALDDNTSATPVWTRPSVAADTDFDIDLDITARGTGANAANGTSDQASAAQRSATVFDVGPPPPEPSGAPIRTEDVGDIEASFSRPDFTSGGGWTDEPNNGSTSSSGTGPGNNSDGPYVYSESSSSSNANQIRTRSTLTALETTMAGWTGSGRVFQARLCVQGNYGAADGLVFQSRLNDAASWETLDTLVGWQYQNDYSAGATPDNEAGETVDIVQAGGWVDFEVEIPDGHTGFRFYNEPAGSSLHRHDAAMWQYEFVDGGGPPPVITTDEDTIYRLSATAPAAPAGGTATESHTPTGWTRVEPAPTTALGVWSATRTRTYTDGTFTSATAWGSIEQVAEPLPDLEAIDTVVAVAGRATQSTVHILGVDTGGNYGVWKKEIGGGDPERLSASSTIRARLNARGDRIAGMTRHRVPEAGGATLLAVQNTANGVPAVTLVDVSETAVTAVTDLGNILAMDGETAESIASETDTGMLVGERSGRVWRLSYDHAAGEIGIAVPVSHRHGNPIVGLARVAAGHLDDVEPDIDRWLDVGDFGDSKRVVVAAIAGDNRDQVTVARLTAGSVGFTVLATNEAIVLPADGDGAVTSYAGAGGEIRVYRGDVRLTEGVTYQRVAATAALAATVDANGAYAVTALADATAAANLVIRVAIGTEVVIDKIVTVTKALRGPRGAGLHTRATLGSSWSNAEANLATPGDNIAGDRVTLYNTAATPPYAETRIWTGLAWEVLVQVIDGSLVVNGTIAGLALAIGTGLIVDAAGNVAVGNLSASLITTGGMSAARITTGGMSAARITTGILSANRIGAVNLSAINVNVGSAIESSDFDLAAERGWRLTAEGTAHFFGGVRSDVRNVRSLWSGNRTVTGTGTTTLPLDFSVIDFDLVQLVGLEGNDLIGIWRLSGIAVEALEEGGTGVPSGVSRVDIGTAVNLWRSQDGMSFLPARTKLWFFRSGNRTLRPK